MLTINDLREQFDIQGEIEVKSFDEMGEDEQTHFNGDVDELSSDNPITDAEIKFMYASQRIHYRDVSGRYSRVAAAAPAHIPIMVIEIERTENLINK